MELLVVNLNICFPEEDAGSQSILGLIENIEFSVRKILGREYSCNISSLPFSPANADRISKDDYYFFILGSESNNSETFQKQLSLISSTIISCNGVNKIPRLFKLLLKPNSEIEQPESLKPYRGYDFFEISVRGNSIKPIDISSRDSNLWTKILDIAYDLKQMTANISNGDVDSKSVYIAGKGDLTSSFYSDIKRGLQYYGYQVLPLVELPDDLEERKVLVKECLDMSEFAIQVIGKKYGIIRQGEKISVKESENDIIQEYLEENKTMVRLIWQPLDIKISDAKQSLFLNRLLKSGIGSNSHVFNVSLQDFIEEISRFVNSSNKSETTEVESAKKTYLMAQDELIKQKLTQKIGELDCTLINEDEIRDTTHAYLNHLDNIKKCDNIIINYSHQNWLHSRLGDIIKVKGMGRVEPWNSMLVFGNGPASIDQYTKWLPDLKLVDNGDFENFNNQMKALL